MKQDTRHVMPFLMQKYRKNPEKITITMSPVAVFFFDVDHDHIQMLDNIMTELLSAICDR